MIPRLLVKMLLASLSNHDNADGNQEATSLISETKSLKMQHTFWQISLWYLIESAIMALISKIVVSSTVFLANLISLEIPVERLNV